MSKQETSQKNRFLPIVVVFVFAAKTVFLADTKIALAEKRPEATLELDNPPFEPISTTFGEAAIARALLLKNLATSGTEKVSEGVYAVGNEIINRADQVASVGGAVADTAHKFYCTVSGWFGVGCEEETAPVVNSDTTNNIQIDVTTPPVVNRRDDEVTEVKIDVRKEYNSSDDDSTSNNSNIINQTVIVQGVTEAELERRLAIFKNSLDLSSGVTIINKSVEGSRISTDRIYEDMNDAANESAENAVTGGTLSFNGINGTFSGDVTVTGTTTINGPLVTNGSAGVSGYVLQSTGTGAQWVATSTLGITGGGGGSGVDTLAFIGSAANACGASISGTTLTLQPASDTFGGIVSTSTQTFAGAKTFATNFGVGTSTATQVFHAYGTGGSKFTRAEPINSLETVLNLVADDSSGTLADGDGAGLSFRVLDADQAEVSLVNIGAYRSGADNSGALRIQTSNAGTLNTQLTILPTGEVGVGTTTPSQLVDIVKNQNTGTYTRTANNDSGTAGIAGFISAAQNANLQILTHGGGRVATRYGVSLANVAEVLSNTGASALLIGTASQNVPIVFGNNAVEVMRIDTNQRLGLGTTTPSAKQHIVSTSEQLRVGYNGSSYYSTSVDANGLATFNAAGTGAGFAFSDAVQLSTLTTDGFLKTCSSNGTLYVDTASYLSCVNNLSLVEVGNTNTVSAYTTSAALGYRNTLTSASSTAVGVSNTVSGVCASAIGSCNTANGERASAVGRSNTTWLCNSSAFGYNNTACGEVASAFGYQNIASTTSASAFGRSNIASGISASVFGMSSTASGGCSTAIGRLSEASGGFALAVGNTSCACGTNSSALGFASHASTLNSVVFGTCNFSGTTGAANVSIGILNNQSGGSVCILDGVISGTIVNATTTPYASTAVGLMNCTIGTSRMSAFGYNNVACGAYGNTALGSNNKACGTTIYGATAVGWTNTANTNTSSAFGYANTASGMGSSASGYINTASGGFGSAMGYTNTASATSTTAFGFCNTASVCAASAFGFCNTASQATTTAVGACNSVATVNSVAIGRSNFVGTGDASVAIGILNNQTGGSINTTTGIITGAPAVRAAGDLSVAVGISNTSSGWLSSTFGYGNTASTTSAVALGYLNTASGAAGPVAIGYANNAFGCESTAMGRSNFVCSNATSSVAMGFGNYACGSGAVSVGINNHAVLSQGYAFGASNVVGCFSTGIGYVNQACGAGKFAGQAVGYRNTVSDSYSTAIGVCNYALSLCSSAFGYCNSASSTNATAIGHCVTNITSCSVEIGVSDTKKFRIGNDGFDFLTNPILLSGSAGTAGQVLTSAGAGVAPAWCNVGGGSSVFAIDCTNRTIASCNSGNIANIGNDNLFIGQCAGGLNIGGSNNTFSGYRAGYSNTYGSNNIFTGYYAGNSNTTGENNIMFGCWAGINNTTGSNNFIAGYNAGCHNTYGSNNVFIGQGEGMQSGYGSESNIVSVGSANIVCTGMSVAIGNGNTASAYGSTAVGKTNVAGTACSSAFGFCNSAFGSSASASGYKNTASGYNSSAFGFSNIAYGNHSSAFGRANDINVYGLWSSAFGAGNYITEECALAVGYENDATNVTAVAVGGYNIASGICSSAFGLCNSAGAAHSSAVGSKNIAPSDCSSAFGTDNTASGYCSSAFGAFNTSSYGHTSAFGYCNIASLYQASAFGYCNVSSNRCASAFGACNTASGSDSSAFGYCNAASATYASAFGSNINNAVATSTKIGPEDAISLHICSASTTAAVAKYQFNGMGGAAITALELDSSGVLIDGGVSDERLKNIDGAYDAGLANILNVNPISYHWNDISGRDQDRQYSGFSAQNIFASIPNATLINRDGYYTVMDRPILAASINAIKELNTLTVASGLTTAGNATEIALIKELIGENGISAESLLKFDALDANVNELFVITTSNTNDIATLGGKIDDIINRVEEFGATVYDGVVHFIDIVVKKITTSELIINNEENPEKTGLIIYDRKTGEPICVYFENGEMKTQEGECEEVDEDEDEPAEEENNEDSGNDQEETIPEEETPIEEPVVEDEGEDTTTDVIEDSNTDSGSDTGDNTDSADSTDSGAAGSDTSDTSDSGSDTSSDSSSDAGGDSGGASAGGDSGESSSTE